MEIKQKLKINTIQTELKNKGYNFLNVDNIITREEKNYYIHILLDVELNLKKQREEIVVETNLSIDNDRYWRYGIELEEFLKKLKELCKKPLLKLKKTSNRKKTPYFDRDLSNLEDSIRDKTILFEDIDISIGKLAKEKLNNRNVVEEIKNILKEQEKTNEINQKLLNRFVYLKDKVLTLNCFLNKKNEYSYHKEKDRTTKLLITDKEYNQKLKEVEDEMKQIAKKFNIELNEFDYLLIPKKVDLDEWVEYNKDNLDDNWNYLDEEEQKEYNSFEEYCKKSYDDNEGIIEVEE